MHRLIRLIKKQEKYVIGLMSGTSMDGIDAALVKIKHSGVDTKIELLNFQTFSYPDQLRDELLIISQPGYGTVDRICQLNFVLGEYFADAALEVCKLLNFNCSHVDLIGTHGQTVHHLPDKKIFFGKTTGSTLQLAEPSVIAIRTGCITVANFRYADMANGGEGAPLVPFFDYLIFKSKNLNRIILNIGGISNITILRKNCAVNSVQAYDTGPGNMVIDALMRKIYDKEYDENGLVALSGKISGELLVNLLQHPFFDKSIPKSTGREDFGNQFVERILVLSKELNLKAEEIIATVTELTVRSIAESLNFSPVSIEDIDELIISGGGVYNKAIMKSLSKYFYKSKILRTDHLNIHGDAKEAICFAVLANETIYGNPSNLPSVTGAIKPAVLGSIYYS